MKKPTTNLSAIEAFARGCMSALLAAGSEDALATRPRRQRNARRAPPVAASPRQPTQTQMAFRDDVRLDEIGEPISAPGAQADMPAPPLTQAQLEAMERVLRGEVPNGYYKPDEGVAPWMES